MTIYDALATPMNRMAYNGFIAELAHEMRSDAHTEDEVEYAVQSCNEFVLSNADAPGDFEFYFDDDHGALLRKGDTEFHPVGW